MEYLGYLLFRAVLFLFNLIPFWIIYLLSDLIRPILQYLFQYRRHVVRAQLRSSFPEANAAWLKKTEKAFYQNISDVLFEAIKGLASDATLISRRVEYEHPELISKHLKNGQSVIMTGSHHCNWEWAAITVAGSVKGEVVGVYKRLTNKYIERYVKVQRAGMGMTLLEMKSTMQSLSEHTAQPAAYVLMADQWPSNPKRAHWAEFMGRETACLPGVDFISRQYGFPVIYYEMTRLRRGFYRISFSELVALERVQEFAEGEITTLNQKRITEQVKTDPANWLWSHKRWKRTRQNVEAEMQNGHSG